MLKIIYSLYKLIRLYLKKEGWIRSVKQGLPVDEIGLALPWFTYCSIHFLKSRLSREFKVFEYGSGNSTIWFSYLTKHIVSVEHNRNWHQNFTDKLKERSNVNYLYKDLKSGEYQNEILNYFKEFDIIVIDGRQRVQCGKNSLKALKEGGVIIWDNSERVEYTEGYEFLMNNGFKKIDFCGLGPINSYSWCTTIFYKESNCLKL